MLHAGQSGGFLSAGKSRRSADPSQFRFRVHCLLCFFCASEECAESLETKKDTEPTWQRLSSQEIAATYWKYIRSDNANFGWHLLRILQDVPSSKGSRAVPSRKERTEEGVIRRNWKTWSKGLLSLVKVRFDFHWAHLSDVYIYMYIVVDMYKRT